MNLKPIKQNMTEIETDKYIVLFSYKTPVAYVDREQMQVRQTSKKWSRTTSRHITQWLRGKGFTYQVPSVDQEVLDSLLK